MIASVDYHKLLVAYMRHVLETEGTTHVRGALATHTEHLAPLTNAERAALIEIRNEVDP